MNLVFIVAKASES